MISRSVYGRGMLLVLLLPMAAACQQAPAGGATAAPVADATTHAKVAAADPAVAIPEAAAGPAPVGLDPADAILAENDRAIAENRRMKQAIEDHRRTDGAKLDGLQASCEQKLGAASDRESAKRIFECVEAGW